MGDFGITGLWLLLALALVARYWSGRQVCGWRIPRCPNRCGRPQRGAGAVHDLRRPRLWCFARIHHRRRLGAVLLREANVSNEASTLTTMYRQTVAMPAPQQGQLRELVRRYTHAVEGPEWENALRTGSGTESARDALNEMYRVLGSEQSSASSSPISQKFLDQLTTLASERNQRT